MKINLTYYASALGVAIVLAGFQYGGKTVKKECLIDLTGIELKLSTWIMK